MTTLTGAFTSILPEGIKRPLRRCPNVLRPTKLWRTLMYHAGVYQMVGRRVNGLHLGCGDLIIPGFWNIDAMFSSASDVAARVDRIKLADNTVGTIYCAHVFEHISRPCSEATLRQWHRVLRPGGKIYIACPDLEALAKLYLERLGSQDTPQGKRQIDLITGVIFGGQHNRYNFHNSGWSFATLRKLLEDVGFGSVRRFAPDDICFRPFSDASSASIDGVAVSLNVEATK